jgi:hypothetical protein
MNEYGVYAHMEATRLELALSAERAHYARTAHGDTDRVMSRQVRGGFAARLFSLLSRTTRSASPSQASTPPTPASDVRAATVCQDTAAVTTANARRTIARAAAAAMRESRRSDESLMRGPI